MSGNRSRQARRALVAIGEGKAMRVLDRAIRESALAAPVLCDRCEGQAVDDDDDDEIQVPWADADGRPAAGRTIKEVPPPDPLPTLTRMVEMRGLIAQVERLAVAQARREGVSWAMLGAALGVSGQAVTKKYGHEAP